MHDLINNIKLEQSLDPAVVTADAAAAGFDRLNFRAALLLATIGESGDTLSGSVLIDVELQHSDALASGYAAVTDAAHINGTMDNLATGRVARIDAAAEDDVIVSIEYHGPKRYVRLNINLTGTHTNGTPIGVLSMGHHPRYIGRNQFSDANVAGT